MPATMADTPEQSLQISIKEHLKPSFSLARALEQNPDFNP
jgi:hypothetical protein